MKILLVMPDASMHKLRVGPWVRSLREAPLTLTTLAALVPESLHANIRLVDCSVDPVPYDETADIVGISAITGTAPRAYALADHFRRRGIPVVLGGVHVTLMPGEAAAHADAIVVGPAEKTWPRLLSDFVAGELKPEYRAMGLDDLLDGVPTPRHDLQRRSGYMMPDVVQATRGCMRHCDFCSVPAVWPRYLRRPVADVVRDVRLLRDRRFVFNDVSLTDDRDYAMELFTALIPLRKEWGGLTTVEVGRDPELLDTMVRSGCRYLLLGFESVNPANLNTIHKRFNRGDDYKEIMAALHAHRISVQGCFVFGMDHDDTSVFASTVDLIDDLRIDIPRYSIYTPYPGTFLFERLLGENRILSFDWNNYDTMHVVIRPAGMSPFELYDGFKWAYRETFRLGRILRRVARPDFNAVINFFGNLTYKIFIHRLYNEQRFALPYMGMTAPETPSAEWSAQVAGEPACRT